MGNFYSVIAFQTIIAEIAKMRLILRRIQSITRYETLDYIDGVKIIDIEKASRRPRESRIKK